MSSSLNNVVFSGSKAGVVVVTIAVACLFTLPIDYPLLALFLSLLFIFVHIHVHYIKQHDYSNRLHSVKKNLINLQRRNTKQ